MILDVVESNSKPLILSIKLCVEYLDLSLPNFSSPNVAIFQAICLNQINKKTKECELEFVRGRLHSQIDNPKERVPEFRICNRVSFFLIDCK